MDTETERERIASVVEAYRAAREAAAALEVQDYGKAREAVTAAVQSLAQYPIPVNV